MDNSKLQRPTRLYIQYPIDVRVSKLFFSFLLFFIKRNSLIFGFSEFFETKAQSTTLIWTNHSTENIWFRPKKNRTSAIHHPDDNDPLSPASPHLRSFICRIKKVRSCCKDEGYKLFSWTGCSSSPIEDSTPTKVKLISVNPPERNRTGRWNSSRIF